MTKETLKKCRIEAKRLWLDGWHLLFNVDDKTCMEQCNGIGAKWMGWFCKIINFFLELFKPASAIHDLRYWLNVGERSKWDDEFEQNCRTLLYDKYGFWHYRRWLGIIAIHQLRAALATFGEAAWKEAGKRFEEVE